ncbi:MAG: NTP transferase domain-containing protein [Bryobacterales bacterium]|nr:NTP transferase domain-containing protein [Bryobacterales bacterium]
MNLRKALVLAAGKGTRMGSLTRELPKPLLPLGGKPILRYVLDRLAGAGIQEIGIVIGYYGDQIRAHLKDYPLPLSFYVQHDLTGTARATLTGRSFCGADPFLLTFGDILCTPADYGGLIRLLEPPAEAVAGVKFVDDPAPGAAVYEEQGRVTRIIEKPPPGTSTTHWNSAGVYAFAPRIFEELERVPLSPRGEYEITSAIAQLLAAHHTVRMYAISGRWMDVGRPEDLRCAESLIASAPQNEP